jgi:ribonuclease P protein component
MERLTQRKDFLAAAAGASAALAGFVLQERARGDRRPARMGFTVSKRVGGAVERNRVRRRLKEIVRLSAATGFKAGSDYVVVGRRAALAMTFAQLAGDFDAALKRLDKGRRGGPIAADAATSGEASRIFSRTGDQSTS